MMIHRRISQEKSLFRKREMERPGNNKRKDLFAAFYKSDVV
jgi:hypothetical protein